MGRMLGNLRPFENAKFKILVLVIFAGFVGDMLEKFTLIIRRFY